MEVAQVIGKLTEAAENGDVQQLETRSWLDRYPQEDKATDLATQTRVERERIRAYCLSELGELEGESPELGDTQDAS
jgi:hypothetical protein